MTRPPQITYCPHHGVHEGHFVEPDPDTPERWRSITWNCGAVTTPSEPTRPTARSLREVFTNLVVRRNGEDVTDQTTVTTKPNGVVVNYDGTLGPDDVFTVMGKDEPPDSPPGTLWSGAASYSGGYPRRSPSDAPGTPEAPSPPEETQEAQTAAQPPAAPQEQRTSDDLVRRVRELLGVLDGLEWRGVLTPEAYPVGEFVHLDELERARDKLSAVLSRFEEERHEAGVRHLYPARPRRPEPDDRDHK